MMNGIYSKKTVFSLLLSCIFVMTACTDMSEVVYSDQTTENFYETTDQVMSAYLAPYTFMQNIMYDVHWTLVSVVTDETAVTVKTGESWEWQDAPRWTQLHQHTWSPGLDWLQWEWNQLWEGIGLCNHFLAEIEGRDLSSLDLPVSQEQMVAEMKVLRALIYYYTMDAFGNIPIVDQIGVPNPPNRSRAEVFEFIERDILDNLNLLGEKGDPGWYGHMTQSSAYAVLASLYINAEVYTGSPRWEDAILASDGILSSGLYVLDSTWDAPFKADNYNSSENILVVPYDANNARGFNPSAQNLPGAMRDAYGFPDYPWGKFVTQESFFNLFSENDLRINQWLYGLQSYIDENGDEQPVWGWYDQDGQQLEIVPEIQMHNNPNHAYGEGVRNIKYEVERGVIFNNNNDLVLFRLSEIYFIKAEAIMRLNGGAANQEVVDLVNQVRERSFEPGDPDAEYTTNTLTMDEFLDERGREFSHEMKRRQDLIRFGKFVDEWWEKPASESYREIFPIPSPFLTVNPALEQNPGY